MRRRRRNGASNVKRLVGVRSHAVMRAHCHHCVERGTLPQAAAPCNGSGVASGERGRIRYVRVACPRYRWCAVQSPRAVLIDGTGGLRLRRTRHAAGADVARCAGPEVTRIAPSGGLASSRSTRSDASRSSSPRAQHQRRRRLWYGSSRRGPVSDRRRVDAAAARGVLRAAEAGPIAHTFEPPVVTAKAPI